MKKYVSVLAMILTVFMLCSSLVGCDLLDTLKQNKEEANKQELFKDLKIEDTFEDGKPYHLYFISNGDGTCALKYVTMDPEYEQDFVLEIPEKSPAGDIVTSIDTSMSSGYCYAGTNQDEQTQEFPYILSTERFESMCETAKTNGISDFDYKKLTAFFTHLSLEGVESKEELLNNCPILSCGDIYMYNGSSQIEKIKVHGYLVNYCEWNTEKYEQSLQEFMDLVKKSDTLEQAEACLSIMRYSDPSRVIGITIPKTVSSVNSVNGEIWWRLSNLHTITVDEDNPYMKMVDGCLVNTETGVLEICLNKDGAIPENAGITTIKNHSFEYFDPQFPGPEAEDISVQLTIPEGVTHMEYFWFYIGDYGADNDISNDYIAIQGKIKIALPESLEFIFVNPMHSGYCYEYAGTMQEWLERVECYHDAGDSFAILVKTVDQTDYVELQVPPVKE